MPDTVCRWLYGNICTLGSMCKCHKQPNYTESHYFNCTRSTDECVGSCTKCRRGIQAD